MIDWPILSSPDSACSGRYSRPFRLSVFGAPGARVVLVMMMFAISVPSVADDPIATRNTNHEEAEKNAETAMPVVHVAEPILHESSGLAVSRRAAKRYWSHNDSGGKPQLFAFDESGHKTGRCRLIDAKAIDWEDMACYREGDVSRILIADCGDNKCRRGSITLYLMDEPDPDASSDVRRYQTLRVTYPDGPHDCEAVAVDTVRGQIILIAKTSLPFAGIYTTPLPARVQVETPETLEASASRIGTLALPFVSAMDVDPISGDVWIVTYFQGFQFPCRDRARSLAEQLSAMPKGIELPKWKQIEAVAVDEEHGVWLTSEGSRTPFAKLKP